MYSTRVTKVRKHKGAIVYDYDVYIGPAIHNRHWNLEQSVWCNPYQFGKVGKARDRLDRYKRDVIDKNGPKMLGKLRQLRGKTLGCICPNIKNCHGHLLAKLAQGDKELSNVFDEDSQSIDIDDKVFFKGEKCPFSNCYFNTSYPIQIRFDDDEGTILKFPFGVRQAFAALKSNKLGWSSMFQSIVDAKNMNELNSVLKSLEIRKSGIGPSMPWNLRQSLQVMFEVLKSKYDADPSFRDYCNKLGDKLPCEATANEYWGCGIDLEALRSLDVGLWKEMMTGRNILGWLIKTVDTERSSRSKNYDWVNHVLNSNDFTDSMKQGLRDVCERLNITACGILQDNKVSWEEKDGELKSATNQPSTTAEDERDREVSLDKKAMLEKVHEEDGTLGVA